MVKEFHQGKGCRLRAVFHIGGDERGGGLVLRLDPSMRNEEGGSGREKHAIKGAREERSSPYVLILAIASLVKSTVRQFESLCEPFIYPTALFREPWRM